MSEELTKRLTQTEKAVHELVPVVQSLADSVGKLREDLKDTTTKLHERVDEVGKLTRPQWQMILGILGALITLIVLHTRPIDSKADAALAWIDARSESLIDDYYQFGKNTARMEHAVTEIETLKTDFHEVLREDAEQTAYIRYMREHLQDVDTGGSRIWSTERKHRSND